ncbi:MAG: AI-2E family transporter [Patescibacteria group bacterium]
MINNFSHLIGKAKKVLLSLREEAARTREENRRLLALEKKLTTTSDKNRGPVQVGISTSSVARATLAILGIIALGWFLLAIKNILALFFIAAFIAVALDPAVDKMQKWHIPRSVGILLIYVVFVGVVGLVLASFVPILANEIPKLATAVLDWVGKFGIDTTAIQTQITNLQNYLTNLQQNLSRENIAAGLSFLGAISQNAFAVVKSVAGGVVNFVFVFVIAFFMTIDENGIKSFLIKLFPHRFHHYLLEKGTLIKDKLGLWMRGQIILMIIIGLLTYVVLKIAGVHYAATLATFAGFTELLPYVGPFLALIPAAILALSQGGPVFALVIVVIYFGVQQLENNIIVPLVMRKAVGLSPIIIMFAMLVGASFPETINPVVGIIISLPIATAISVFVNDYSTREK